jgi:hypothetical protein
VPAQYVEVCSFPSYWNENHYITVIWQTGHGDKPERQNHTQKHTKIVGLDV